MDSAGTISQRNEVRGVFVARTSVDGLSAGAFAIVLRYAATDPYALWITLDGTDVCCARDLLFEAVAGVPSGEGDVHVRCDDDYAYFELPLLHEWVVARVSRSDVEAFAAATADQVPRGGEGRLIDVDAAVTQLLG